MPRMITLAIDTSCDETSASIVQDQIVLSNIQPSQMEYHKKYGGVVPNLARLAHQERIDNVILEACKKAFPGSKNQILENYFKNINFIAVTIGPGLAIALEIGIKKAKELAQKYDKPLILINHMEGHLLSGFATRNSHTIKPSEILAKPAFPALGILVSGGHTELIKVSAIGEYKIIGETGDDSLGECFDKCGRMLGLGYPAGPLITKLAKEHRENMELKVENRHKSTLVIGLNKKSKKTYELPIPMARTENLHMSYSGLKTAFNHLVHSLSKAEINETQNKFEQDNIISSGLTKEIIYDLCVMLEASAYEQLLIKTEKAILQFEAKELWLGGGVIASPRLRHLIRKLAKRFNIPTVRVPYSKKLTTDNAAMIGVAANINIQYNSATIIKEHFKQVDRIPSLTLNAT